MQVEAQAKSSDDIDVPLCVDLDGTLVRSDVLVESIFALLGHNLLYIFLLPVWLLGGKAHFKQQIAQRVELDVSVLPYQGPFLDYLKQERAKGRSLVLTTASNIKFAGQIASHLGLFERVLASDAETNLSGITKLQRLQEVLDGREFDYAGNAMVDLRIWPHARQAIIVNPEYGVQAATQRIAHVARVFDDQRGNIKNYLKAMRLHQWLKNLLVFVPLIMDHRIGELVLLGQASLCFIAFSLCASSVYLLNDLLDLNADRHHPTKCKRPFAAGAIPIVHGTLLIPLLLISSFGLALFLPIEFLGVLALYYVVTLAYSLRLKRIVLLDVLLLAGLYTTRLLAGGAAASVALSFWLLAFSMFLFLSLALVKRYSELLLLQDEGKEKIHGRGYQLIDLDTLMGLGTSSGNLAVLVLALYINSDAVKMQYTYPQALWLLCPLMLYWISRVWILTRRGELHEDPILFALEDRRSHFLAVIGAAILLTAA